MSVPWHVGKFLLRMEKPERVKFSAVIVRKLMAESADEVGSDAVEKHLH